MEEFRSRIDKLDNQIMELLIDRLNVVKEIGEYKKENNIPVYDKSREDKIYQKIEDYFLLDGHRLFLKSIYNKIMEETKKVQNNLNENENNSFETEKDNENYE
jgi:chorismate mutase/prephenate dehydratase